MVHILLKPGLEILSITLLVCEMSPEVRREGREDSAARIASFSQLICASSAFSKSSLNIWKFSVHILLKPSLKDFEPWALSLPDKELCLREALAVCTPPAPEPSAKR